VALVLVGVTLAQAAIGAQLRGRVGDLADQDAAAPGADGGGRLAVRSARHAAGGDGGGPASLPVGAKRVSCSRSVYRKAEDLVTASVAVSTVLALLSVSLVMALLPKLPG
jgi:malonate transporter